jgi:heterodisulfide reductase subunit B
MTRDDIDSMHTCHNECQRPACVAARKAVTAERTRRVSYVCPQCFYTLEENQWVGLTRDERMEIINRLAGQDWVYVVDEIEAKLKEKNQNERTN